MSIKNENKNQIVKENSSEKYSETFNFNLNKVMPSPNQKENYINDLFSINNDENNNIFSHKSNTFITKMENNSPNKIIKTNTEYNHKLNLENNKIKNNDEISLSIISSNENILRIEYANKLFDETSGPNSIDVKSIKRKITKDSNMLPIGKVESNMHLNEIKNKYTVHDKIEEDRNEIKEENISYMNNNDNNPINNIYNIINSNNINDKNIIDNNDKKIDLGNDLNNNRNDKIVNGIDKTELNTNTNITNNINNNELEINESISIGDIDVEALPKFTNSINFKNNNILKIKENNDKNIDKEILNNDELNKNLNINEYINNMNLANKLKSKNHNKKKKHNKNKIINKDNECFEADNSNIPLNKNKKNILDVVHTLSNKNIYRDKNKEKEKDRDKALNINKLSAKNNQINLLRINSSEKYTIEKNKNIIDKRYHTISTNPKNSKTLNIINNSENYNINIDNGKPKVTNNNLDNMNNINIDTKNIINENNNYDIINNMVKLYGNNVDSEISYFEFLKKNNFYIQQNDNDIDKELEIWNNKRKIILENVYFTNYILKQETIYDKINKYNINEPLPILYQYLDNVKAYEDYKSEFNHLFQYINDKEKNYLYQKYKDIHYNQNNIYKINPYLNDYNNFKKIFEKDKNCNNNFEYIRFNNEDYWDSFYRSFIFNYIEMNLINKNLKEICILIIDLFKIYDIEPLIFNIEKSKINFKNILICFSIIYDFIKINLWDKAYKFFISIYNEILDKALIYYLKYNIFLFLSKIDFVLNIDKKNKTKKKKHYKNDEDDYSEEFQFDHFALLIEGSDPTKIIFQTIPYLFGISLNIFFYDNEKYDNNLYMNNILFNNPYNEEENEKKIINLFFCYNNYYICYKKPFLNSNGNDIVDKALFEAFVYNLNSYYLVSKNINFLSKYKYCELCNKNCNVLELKHEIENNIENILICDQCLFLQIDEHLLQRNIFLHKEKLKNYLYYLKPITLKFFSQKDKNNIFNLSLSNSDYIHLYNKTFNERISQIMHEICLHCFKKGNLVKIDCGCQICFNCIKALVIEKTKTKIVINIYEKKKLEKKNFQCPICHKKLNIDNIIPIYKQYGINLENKYHEAIERLKIICQKRCFFCSKKLNKINVDNNIIKTYFKLNIKKSIEENNLLNGNNLDEMINICEDPHIICSKCHKILSKNKKVIKNGENMYKKIFCNICYIEHYIDMKEWNSFLRLKACCKCVIF